MNARRSARMADAVRNRLEAKAAPVPDTPTVVEAPADTPSVVACSKAGPVTDVPGQVEDATALFVKAAEVEAQAADALSLQTAPDANMPASVQSPGDADAVADNAPAPTGNVLMFRSRRRAA